MMLAALGVVAPGATVDMGKTGWRPEVTQAKEAQAEQLLRIFASEMI